MNRYETTRLKIENAKNNLNNRLKQKEECGEIDVTSLSYLELARMCVNEFKSEFSPAYLTDAQQAIMGAKIQPSSPAAKEWIRRVGPGRSPRQLLEAENRRKRIEEEERVLEYRRVQRK